MHRPLICATFAVAVSVVCAGSGIAQAPPGADGTRRVVATPPAGARHAGVAGYYRSPAIWG